jgi:hypothetical protein
MVLLSPTVTPTYSHYTRSEDKAHVVLGLAPLGYALFLARTYFWSRES